MELTEKKCVPCEGGVAPLKADEIEMYLKELSKPWEVIDGKVIERKFYFTDYMQTLNFVRAVGLKAEEEGHHPEMHVFYGQVTVNITTWAIEGLSENDFILAAKINELPEANG